jgi:N-carbamoylputrescine amidase
MRAASSEWAAISREVSDRSPHLFLLNEMPFGGWISAGPRFEVMAWERSCRAHEEGMESLGDLGAAWVAGSRPFVHGDRHLNQAFIWNAAQGTSGIHTKQYFPDEEGYHEARWFQRGGTRFQVASMGPLRAGFLICTEVMFNEHARRYGRAGAHILLVPRAVGAGSLDRWLVAMRMAAIVSGCYVLSSNRGGIDSAGQAFGGCGWIIDPAGDLVAKTTGAEPVVFHEIDLDRVRKAQREYPCYVEEIPVA